MVLLKARGSRRAKMRFVYDQGGWLVTAELNPFHSKSSLSHLMEENSGVSAKSLSKNLKGFTALFLMKTLVPPIGAPALSRLSGEMVLHLGTSHTSQRPLCIAALTWQSHTEMCLYL